MTAATILILTHTKIHLTTSIHILYLLFCSDKYANSLILPEFDSRKQMLCIRLEKRKNLQRDKMGVFFPM
jgi:hypothetical protein